MITAISDNTGHREVCTIFQGVVGCDGVRRFEIADIDLFGMFDYVQESGQPLRVMKKEDRGNHDAIDIFEVAERHRYNPAAHMTKKFESEDDAKARRIAEYAAQFEANGEIDYIQKGE